jgi:uncharacterized protein YbaA (DUF1428 family)
MAYVDGFVAAVPTENRAAYLKMAEQAAVVFKEHGAVKVVERWGDDVPEGKLTSFPLAVKREEGETGVFVDRLAVARSPRRRLAQGDGRSPPRPRRGPSVRRPAADLRRFRDSARKLTAALWC